MAIVSAAHGQSFETLHDFAGTQIEATGASGAASNHPASGVTLDASGNMYGTTQYGGVYNLGNVWEITKSGVYEDLHDFGGTTTWSNGQTGPDGYNVDTAVTTTPEGNIYGSAGEGGAYKGGIVWEITSGGTYKDVRDFGGTITTSDGHSGADGTTPSSVTFDSSGNMFGTAFTAGQNTVLYNGYHEGAGMLWEITTAGKYKDLHDFGGTVKNSSGKSVPDGYFPSQVSLDSSGNIYGTTEAGGTTTSQAKVGFGVVWKYSAAGVFTVVHNFGGTAENIHGATVADGAEPLCGVTISASGDIVGTASRGGQYGGTEPNYGGMVWGIDTTGHYYDLHDFNGTITDATGHSSADGQYPASTVAFDNLGNLYGTAVFGGPNHLGGTTSGMAWMISTSGDYSDVHDFGGTANLSSGGTGIDGSGPGTNLAIGSDGTLYGTAITGGPSGLDNEGTVWRFTPAAVLVSVRDYPTSVTGGGSSLGAVTLQNPAPSGGVTVDLATNNAAASVHSTVVVPAGQTEGLFAITSVPVTANTTASITAKLNGLTKATELVVLAPTLQSISLNYTSVTGGDTRAKVTATLTLTGNVAAANGLTVKISSNSSVVTVPSSETIGMGSSTYTFTVGKKAVTFATKVTITATYLNVTKTATITIEPGR
jgi:uncharacterized repeat protein (TIGR03803 family)